jgi:hypothetical protein
MNDQVQYWIERFRRGDRESAFHGLLEAGREAIPDMISVFHATSEHELRAFLAEVIRYCKDPSTISFLGEAINDPDPGVWKEGMDVLVSLASRPALDVLQSARNRQFTKQQNVNEFREWLEEAIKQTEETIRD